MTLRSKLFVLFIEQVHDFCTSTSREEMQLENRCNGFKDWQIQILVFTEDFLDFLKIKLVSCKPVPVMGSKIFWEEVMENN